MLQPDMGFAGVLLHVARQGPRFLPSDDPGSPRALEEGGGLGGPGLQGVCTSPLSTGTCLRGGAGKCSPAACPVGMYTLGSLYFKRVGISASKAQTGTDLGGGGAGGSKGGLEGEAILAGGAGRPWVLGPGTCVWCSRVSRISIVCSRVGTDMGLGAQGSQN